MTHKHQITLVVEIELSKRGEKWGESIGTNEAQITRSIGEWLNEKTGGMETENNKGIKLDTNQIVKIVGVECAHGGIAYMCPTCQQEINHLAEVRLENKRRNKATG